MLNWVANANLSSHDDHAMLEMMGGMDVVMFLVVLKYMWQGIASRDLCIKPNGAWPEHSDSLRCRFLESVLVKVMANPLRVLSTSMISLGDVGRRRYALSNEGSIRRM